MDTSIEFFYVWEETQDFCFIDIWKQQQRFVVHYKIRVEHWGHVIKATIIRQMYSITAFCFSFEVVAISCNMAGSIVR